MYCELSVLRKSMLGKCRWGQRLYGGSVSMGLTHRPLGWHVVVVGPFTSPLLLDTSIIWLWPLPSGGRLISLNHISLEGVTFSEAAEVMQSSPEEVQLIISQPKGALRVCVCAYCMGVMVVWLRLLLFFVCMNNGWFSHNSILVMHLLWINRMKKITSAFIPFLCCTVPFCS